MNVFPIILRILCSQTGIKISLKKALKIFLCSLFHVVQEKISSLPRKDDLAVTKSGAQLLMQVDYLHEATQKDTWILYLSCLNCKMEMLAYGLSRRWDQVTS